MALWGRLQSFNSKMPDVDLVDEVVLDKKKRPITEAIIPRDKLSSPHCKLYLKDGCPFLEDLKSKHGTFVNGEKLAPGVPRALRDKDNITLYIPSITHSHYDTQKHFAFCFNFIPPGSEAPATPSSSSSKRSTSTPKKKRAPSKFDVKKKLVSSNRGISVVSGTGRTFSGKQSLEAPEEFVGQLKFKPGSRVLEDLEKAIKENNEEWLTSFLDIGGLSTVLRELEIRLKKGQMNNLDKLISYHSVKVIHQIMQQEQGFRAILQKDNAFGIISLGLSSDHVKLQALVPLLLAAVACISTQGHAEVVDAMGYYQKQKNERTRFRTLVSSLKTEDDLEYKTNVMRLINAIIGRYENLEKRISMRQEFKQLGLLDIIEGLRYDDDKALNTEIDIFEELMEEDGKLTMVNNVDLSDPVAIANALVTQTHGKALQYFTEIMQQLFTIPVGSVEGISTWALTEDVVRSSTTQETSKKHAPKKLDFQTIRKMKKSPQPDNLLQQDQDAMRQELNELRNELNQTKVKHLQEVNDLVDKYATEKKELQKSLETEIATLRDRLEAARAEPAIPIQTEEPVETSPPPPADIPAPPPPSNIPAPPPPMLGGPPPPPGIGGATKPSYADKYPFKPSVQMKKFYWKAIPPREIPGTMWEDINFDEVDYLEPVELEKLFGAKKKADKEKAAKVEKEEENPYKNMIDLKRSNNIGIMLKHFKLAPTAIKRAIIEMDEEVLTPEKISQLYRNAPTPEETELLSQFNGDPRELGKSEQFLLQMVQIPDVTERLEILHFRCNFDEEIEDLKHHYNTVVSGVEQVLESKLLGDVCKLILAIGNFLNYGQWKAPTQGFKIEFLTKVTDTRTTDNTLNMMHYMTGLLADKHPALLELVSELDMIGNASRIPVSKLNTDVTKITTMLSQIKRLIKKDADSTEFNHFKEVILSFSLHAKRELEIVVDNRNKLQQLSDKLFEKIPFTTSLPIEEALGVLSEFLLCFSKCHEENEQEQANREMKERMAKKRAEREAATKERKEKKANRPKKGGLMDGAFATLRGGGMKTFRAKAMAADSITNFFSEEAEKDISEPETKPTQSDFTEQPVPTSAPVVSPDGFKLESTDSADILESMMDELE